MYVYVCIYVCMYVCIMSRDSLTFLFLNTRLDYLEDLKVKKKKKKLLLVNDHFFLFKLFFYLLFCQGYYDFLNNIKF